MQGQHNTCTCTCSSEGEMIRKSGKAPALIACAEVMMAHCCAWRNMWRRSMTGTTPESMAAANTDPGPTGANWSGSPAKQCATLNLHLLVDPRPLPGSQELHKICEKVLSSYGPSTDREQGRDAPTITS